MIQIAAATTENQNGYRIMAMIVEIVTCHVAGVLILQTAMVKLIDCHKW